MKLKIEYVVLFTVILGLSVYLLYSEKDQTHYQLPEIEPISASEITKIQISEGERTIQLMKEGDEWYISPKDYLADTHKVERMLKAIGDLSLTAMVSASQNYERYDLHGGNKIAAQAWKGDKLVRSLDIGKTAPSFRHTFLKLNGDDRVYHGRGNFRGDFDKTVADLRDKTVLAFETADIREVTLVKDDTRIEFVRREVSPPAPADAEEGQQTTGESESPTQPQLIWTIPNDPGNRTADKDEIERFLGTLSRLTCDSYLQDAEKGDFAEPIYTVRLKGLEEYTLSLFAKEAADASLYPATSSENIYPFYLRQGQAENLMKAPEDLIEESEPD